MKQEVRDHVRKFRWEWIALGFAALVLAIALGLHLLATDELKMLAESRSAPAQETRQAIVGIHRIDSTTRRIEDSTNVALGVSRSEFQALQAKVDSLQHLLEWMAGQ